MKHIKTIFHEKNLGKGSAIKNGLKVCQGDYNINSRRRFRI